MPASAEALLIFVFAVVPGFVAWRVAIARFPRVEVGGVRVVLSSLFVGLVLHALVGFYTVDVSDALLYAFQQPRDIFAEEHFTTIVFWLFIVMLAAPIAFGWFLSVLFEKERLQSFLTWFGLSTTQRMPTAWDWFFYTQSEGCWFIAEYDDGTLVAGEYGESSFASLTPFGKDLFLERGYYVDESGEVLCRRIWRDRRTTS